jgi:hypothetical protein
MIIDNLFNRKPTIVEGSAANDYFTRRKSEEERIAGTRAPVKNKKNPAETDYSKRRAQEKKVHQGVAEGKVINTYLWHGSRQKIPMLEPRQSVDTGGAAGSNQNAIYATSDPKVAIAMGLTTAGSDTGMFPNDPQMVLFSGKIRKGEYVYLHKLPFNGPDEKPQFVQGGNSREFHSIPGVEGIKPIEIKEIPVNKYLNLIRKATPSDLKLRKKYMKEQGVAEGSELRKKYMKKAIKEVVHPDIFDKHISNEPTEKVRMDDFEFKARPFRGRILGHGNLNDIGLTITAHDRQNVIGWAHFVVKSDEKGNQWLESEWTEVDDDYMSRGVAAMMYAFAKSLGNDIKPSPHQSTWGKRMWKKWGKDAKHLVGEQGVAEGLEDSAEKYKAHLLKTAPRIMDFLAKTVKGWRPSEQEMLGAIDTAYTVMKHTGDVKQAGKAMMDELNTLHRMSQGQQGVAEGGYSGIDDTDTVGFSVNSERAYNAVMARFGDQIDHDETSGILYVPARLWPKVEMVAFDADGEGATQTDGLDEGEKVGNMDADDFDAAMARLKKLAGAGPMKTVYDPVKRVYKNVPQAEQPKKPNTGSKTVSESRVKRRALIAQMLNGQ